MKSSGFKWFPDEPIFLAQADAIKATGLQRLGCKSGICLSNPRPVGLRLTPPPVSLRGDQVAMLCGMIGAECSDVF